MLRPNSTASPQQHRQQQAGTHVSQRVLGVHVAQLVAHAAAGIVFRGMGGGVVGAARSVARATYTRLGSWGRW